MTKDRPDLDALFPLRNPHTIWYEADSGILLLARFLPREQRYAVIELTPLERALWLEVDGAPMAERCLIFAPRGGGSGILCGDRDQQASQLAC